VLGGPEGRKEMRQGQSVGVKGIEMGEIGDCDVPLLTYLRATSVEFL